MVIDTLDREVRGIQTRYPDTQLVALSEGIRVVVPRVALPSGWTAAETSVTIIVPPGYPTQRPDCFYADESLRLASGAEPASTSLQPLDGRSYRWFSWHIDTWDSLADDMSKYLRSVERRLWDVR